MRQNRRPVKGEKLSQILAEAQRTKEQRAAAYRDRALKIFPHICAHCGREFSGKRLRELTVHHKDHNHENNPPDGSNWELLCIYCHDREHQRYVDDEALEYETQGEQEETSSTYKPFAVLKDLLKDKK